MSPEDARAELRRAHEALYGRRRWWQRRPAPVSALRWAVAGTAAASVLVLIGTALTGFRPVPAWLLIVWQLLAVLWASWAGYPPVGLWGEPAPAGARCGVYADGRHRCDCADPYKTGRPPAPGSVWPPLDPDCPVHGDGP